MQKCYLSENQSQLVLNNIGLAYKFAQPYSRHPRYDDLVSSSLLGLCEAALRWDGRAAFSTYAYYWMKQYVNCELRGPEPLPDSNIEDLLQAMPQDSLTERPPPYLPMLLRLIANLPEKERHVILLKYPIGIYSGTYSDADIAAMLECSTTWVGFLRKRAFGRLKEGLRRGGVLNGIPSHQVI